MRIVGLDLSLTSTGVAGRDWCDRITTKLRKAQGGELRGHERLAYLRQRVRDFTVFTDLVVVEGPSYGSKGSAYHQLAGLWWLIAHDLWDRHVAYAVVTPQQRALYATGKAGAGKDEVLAAVVRRFPDIEVNGNDEADAVVLAAMGYDHYGDHPVVDMPAAHRAALVKVEWPDFALREAA